MWKHICILRIVIIMKKKSYYAISTKHNFISLKNKSKILPFLLTTKYSAKHWEENYKIV